MAAAAFLAFLIATGVPLQFSAALDLGARHVSSALLLDWYGLQAPEDVWASEGVVAVGDSLFLAESGDPVGTLSGFRGAVALGDMVAAAGDREVLLLTAGEAEPLDRFRMDTPIRRIGRYGERPALGTSAGVLLADRDLVNWEPVAVSAGSVHWSTPRRPDDPETYRRRFRERMLTVERLLQDAHSGRLLGAPGVILVDLASVLLLFLAGSGLLMWWRTLRR